MPSTPLDSQRLLAHGALVRRVARAVLGGDDEVDDVVQDTWLAALGAAPRRPRRLRAWLVGIARRQAALRVRGRVRERRRVRTRAARTEAPVCAPDPADIVETAETGRRLVAAVLTLPEHERMAILLRYHDNLPPRAIAARLGVPVETVRTRVRRGLASLRARLDEDHGGGVWRAALLPLATGEPAAAQAVSGVAIGGGLVSTKLLSATAVLVAVVASVLWWSPWRGLPGAGAGDRRTAAAEASSAETAEEASLDGSRAARTPDVTSADLPSAPDSDFLTLARRIWWSREDRKALAAWGRRDPTIAARTVDWLHPRHDADRRETFEGRPLPPVSWNDVRAVFEVLAGIGPPIVDLLVAEIDDPDAHMRERVVHALGYLGPTAAPAVPALVAVVEGEERDLVPHALGALGCIGPGARAALPVFARWLRETWRDDAARAAAAAGILQIAEPTPDVLETCSIALRDGSYDVAVQLLPAIAALRERAAPLAGVLQEVLLDESNHEWIRLHAVDALGCVGANDDDAAATLLRLASDPEAPESVRAASVQALVRLGPATRTGLLRTAASFDDDERLLVVSAVADAEVAVLVGAEPLLSLLDPLRADEDAGIKCRAIATAIPVLYQTRAGIPWMARWMEDASPLVRARALRALSDVWDEDGRVLEAARRALGDPDASVRLAGIRLLACRAADRDDDGDWIRSRESLPILVRAAHDESEAVRLAAVPLLEKVSPADSARALPTWIAMLHSEWPSEVLLAAGVVKRLGPAARDAAPALRDALARDPIDPVRARLEDALAEVEGR